MTRNPTISTPDRHANIHTTRCTGRIIRDYAGNRECTHCRFTWSAAGWREELKDRKERDCGRRTER